MWYVSLKSTPALYAYLGGEQHAENIVVIVVLFDELLPLDLVLDRAIKARMSAETQRSMSVHNAWGRTGRTPIIFLHGRSNVPEIVGLHDVANHVKHLTTLTKDKSTVPRLL
jgi:hypothetical protein